MSAARIPTWIYVPAAVGAAFVVIPLVAIVARVDWGGFGGLITSESSRAAFVLSDEGQQVLADAGFGQP